MSKEARKRGKKEVPTGRDLLNWLVVYTIIAITAFLLRAKGEDENSPVMLSLYFCLVILPAAWSLYLSFLGWEFGRTDWCWIGGLTGLIQLVLGCLIGIAIYESASSPDLLLLYSLIVAFLVFFYYAIARVWVYVELGNYMARHKAHSIFEENCTWANRKRAAKIVMAEMRNTPRRYQTRKVPTGKAPLLWLLVYLVVVLALVTVSVLYKTRTIVISSSALRDALLHSALWIWTVGMLLPAATGLSLWVRGLVVGKTRWRAFGLEALLSVLASVVCLFIPRWGNGFLQIYNNLIRPYSHPYLYSPLTIQYIIALAVSFVAGLTVMIYNCRARVPVIYAELYNYMVKQGIFEERDRRKREAKQRKRDRRTEAKRRKQAAEQALIEQEKQRLFEQEMKRLSEQKTEQELSEQEKQRLFELLKKYTIEGTLSEQEDAALDELLDKSTVGEELSKQEEAAIKKLQAKSTFEEWQAVRKLWVTSILWGVESEPALSEQEKQRFFELLKKLATKGTLSKQEEAALNVLLDKSTVGEELSKQEEAAIYKLLDKSTFRERQAFMKLYAASILWGVEPEAAAQSEPRAEQTSFVHPYPYLAPPPASSSETAKRS